MSDKELYRQKMQAELDQWQAEVDKLKARASGASAEAQLGMNKQIKALESNIEEGKAKLAEVAQASDAAWETLKEGFESAWGSVRVAFSEASSKFNK
jgi:predicted  nucleic acid-binding Zn-ribbon protein